MSTIDDQTISLAAVFQAADLVNRLAQSGELDDDKAAAILRPVFIVDADSIPGSYQRERADRSRRSGSLQWDDCDFN